MFSRYFDIYLWDTSGFESHLPSKSSSHNMYLSIGLYCLLTKHCVAYSNSVYL